VLGADLHYDGEAGGRRSGAAPMGLCLSVVRLRVWCCVVCAILAVLAGPTQASKAACASPGACARARRVLHLRWALARFLPGHTLVPALVSRRKAFLEGHVVLLVSVGVPGS
jgi:hypothetical protein